MPLGVSRPDFRTKRSNDLCWKVDQGLESLYNVKIQDGFVLCTTLLKLECLSGWFPFGWMKHGQQANRVMVSWKMTPSSCIVYLKVAEQTF